MALFVISSKVPAELWQRSVTQAIKSRAFFSLRTQYLAHEQRQLLKQDIVSTKSPRHYDSSCGSTLSSTDMQKNNYLNAMHACSHSCVINHSRTRRTDPSRQEKKSFPKPCLPNKSINMLKQANPRRKQRGSRNLVRSLAAHPCVV
jgi:hypothetical protein